MGALVDDAGLTLYEGDCRAVLPTLPEASVHCVVTSPPYWGLRDYGVEGQIGLEPTPEAWLATMVEVFREVRRVLRDDGTLWLNLGDSYASPPSDHPQRYFNGQGATYERGGAPSSHRGQGQTRRISVQNLKPKDLVGQPWRLALALQADGWYLRADIIWHKPNPMPESVTDRPTKAHEYVFLLTKSARYFYDADAVREPSAPGTVERFGNGGAPRLVGKAYHRDRHDAVSAELLAGRNLRSVWTIPTAPYPDAHFATFPPELARRCIVAGSRVGDTILDPFAGSGTVGEVAEHNGRHALLIELSPAYTRQLRTRTAQRGLFSHAAPS